MKAQSKNKERTAEILEIFSKEKSVDAVVSRIRDIEEKDVWAAVSEAASLISAEVKHSIIQKKYELNIDGSAVPNPGDAGIGIVISSGGKVIKRISKPIGRATNNIAEYTALIEGLKEALKYTKIIAVYSDSELLVNQVNGS